MVVISMSKKKVNKKRNLVAKQNITEKQNLHVIPNPRLDELQNRELVDETEETVIETANTEEFAEKEVSKFRLGVTWFLTILISTLITYLLVVLGAQLTAGVTAVTLAYQSVLSSDTILVSSTAFTTSSVWVLVFKVKLYERLFQLFSRRFGGK